MTNLSYMVHTIAANDLAMQEARASAAMVMTWFSWNILVLLTEKLIYQIVEA